MLFNLHHGSYAALYCCLDFGTCASDEEGEGWPQKLAEAKLPKEAQHMANLAQMKHFGSLFPPCGLPFPHVGLFIYLFIVCVRLVI